MSYFKIFAINKRARLE